MKNEYIYLLPLEWFWTDIEGKSQGKAKEKYKKNFKVCGCLATINLFNKSFDKSALDFF